MTVSAVRAPAPLGPVTVGTCGTCGTCGRRGTPPDHCRAVSTGRPTPAAAPLDLVLLTEPDGDDADAALEALDLDAFEVLVARQREAATRPAVEMREVHLRVGRVLTAARRKLRHGEFQAWAKARFGYSPQHCRKLMALWRKRARVRALPTEMPLRAVLAVLVEESIAHAEPPVATVYVAPVLPDSQIVLEVGDAAELDPPRPFDLALTSPPYDLGMDYGQGPDGPVCDHHGRRAYRALALEWASALYRAAALHARLCVNVPLDTSDGGERRPMYADWVDALLRAGWTYRTTILWMEGGRGHARRSAARGSLDSPAAPYVMAPIETIIVCHRGDWNLASDRQRQADRPRSDLLRAEWLDWTNGVWLFPGEQPARVGHPAPMPEELARRCLKLFSFPGALVCDPFVGSGTVAAVAARLGRRCYGLDLNAAFVARARARVAREVERTKGAAAL